MERNIKILAMDKVKELLKNADVNFYAGLLIWLLAIVSEVSGKLGFIAFGIALGIPFFGYQLFRKFRK